MIRARTTRWSGVRRKQLPKEPLNGILRAF
jgi:hypothetical protein